MELNEKLKIFVNYFDEWADAIFLNASQDFIQDNYAENKLYKIISSSFQDFNELDLDKLKSTKIYQNFKENMYMWQDLYENKMFQNPKGVEIWNKITFLALEITNEFEKNPELFSNFKFSLLEISDLKKQIDFWIGNKIKDSDLEILLMRTFNLIEKSYVELAYSKIDEKLKNKGIEESSFWEEPIMEYIMETWWPKRRVYKNKILLIDIDSYPQKISFSWKQYMSDKFYSCGIFNFLKQLRNQLTHVKTSEYHNEVIKELFSREFLLYWCKMNCTIVTYIIAYLMTN